MRTLIIYLSISQNTENVAHEISSKLGNCTLRKIELHTRVPKSSFMRIFKFGFYQTFGLSPRYSIDLHDKNDYDLIIFGSPVWIGRVAPPILDLIKKEFRGHSKLAFFSTYGADNSKVVDRLIIEGKLKGLISSVGIQSPVEGQDEDTQYSLNKFVGQIEEKRDEILGKKVHLSEVIKGSVQSHLN